MAWQAGNDVAIKFGYLFIVQVYFIHSHISSMFFLFKSYFRWYLKLPIGVEILGCEFYSPLNVLIYRDPNKAHPWAMLRPLSNYKCFCDVPFDVWCELEARWEKLEKLYKRFTSCMCEGATARPIEIIFGTSEDPVNLAYCGKLCVGRLKGFLVIGVKVWGFTQERLALASLSRQHILTQLM